jgi:hypothetical protein
MSGQISLEFILYTVFAVIALAGILFVYRAGLPTINKSEGIDYIGELVSSLNSRMGSMYAQFTAYVPKAICNTTINGGYAEVYGERFAVDGNIVLSNAICDGSGSVQLVVMSYTNGNYLVS